MEVETPAVLVGDTELTYVDLALTALLEGDWQRFTRRSAAGAIIAAEGRADPGAAKELGMAFRYQRGLLAADDLRAWLTARDLSADDWNGHLARWASATEQATDGNDIPTSDEIAGHWWADACLSGLWEQSARNVAGWWAASRLVDDAGSSESGVSVDELHDRSLAVLVDDPSSTSSLTDRLERLAQWRQARHSLEAQRCTPEALQRWLAKTNAAWTEFEYSELRTATEHAAREARLCLEVDELSFEEVAERSGRPATRIVSRFADIDRSFGSALLSGTPGSPVGPIPVASDWVVAVLHDQRSPTLDDPVVLAAARAAIVDDIIEQELAGRVRELAPL